MTHKSECCIFWVVGAIIAILIGWGGFKATDAIGRIDDERNKRQKVVDDTLVFSPRWERIRVENGLIGDLYRTRTPTGWLVKWNNTYGSDLEFVPDLRPGRTCPDAWGWIRPDESPEKE